MLQPDGHDPFELYLLQINCPTLPLDTSQSGSAILTVFAGQTLRIRAAAPAATALRILSAGDCPDGDAGAQIATLAFFAVLPLLTVR